VVIGVFVLVGVCLLFFQKSAFHCGHRPVSMKRA
jgi:hypothetical protein